MLRRFSFWNPTDAARGWMGGWHFCVWLAICVPGAGTPHLRLNSSGAQKYCALFVTAGAIRSFSGAARIVGPKRSSGKVPFASSQKNSCHRAKKEFILGLHGYQYYVYYTELSEIAFAIGKGGSAYADRPAEDKKPHRL